MNKIYLIPVLAVLAIFLLGCTQPGPPVNENPFIKVSDSLCKDSNKPLIRYYSTTWCPHCQYINPVFNQVMGEYKDKVVFRHYELDVNMPTGDDLVEYKLIAPNGNVPAFSFGCKYYRIGNSFESTKNTAADANEFRRVLDLLIQ